MRLENTSALLFWSEASRSGLKMDFFPVGPGPFLPDITIDRKSKDDLSLNLDLENLPENIFDKQEPEEFIEPTKVGIWKLSVGV